MSRTPLLIAILVSANANAAGSFIEPERLTSGAAYQFLAVLDPSAERLFYVTNENATTEIFGADMATRSPQRLFDDSADATWPRVSPDGTKLLYISFRNAATGELCIRDLPKQGLVVSDRRCLPLGGRAALQALWQPDSRNILVVVRSGLGGEVELRRLNVDAPGTDGGVVVLKRDLSSPAISPDGQWLLYVPVTRQTGAPTTGTAPPKTLALTRLDATDRPARDVKFEQPGLPGFPEFSADGKFVYFAQYLNDTNRDGVVNADDRAVLFRAAFDGTKENPIDFENPQQLTSADWDCQYPFPGKDRLIATCLQDGSLDVFSLPLDGVIPVSWTREKLVEELKTNRMPWERLLVYTRLAEIDTEPAQDADHLKRIIEMHLQMKEYQSAGFYSRLLEELSKKQTGDEWRQNEGIAQILHELARHRRSDVATGEGQSRSDIDKAARERLAKIAPMLPSPLPAVAALATLVSSEVDQSLGDIGQALALLSGIQTDDKTLPVVLHMLGERSRELYGLLDDREKLLAVDLLLSAHPLLPDDERLQYAEDYVHDLLRGVEKPERSALLDSAMAKLDPGSNAAFAVTVERELAPLNEKTQAGVETKVFALFDANAAYERRRAIVHETIAKSKAVGAEALWYDMAQKWTQSVDKSHTDRKRTEALYRKVALERAYVEWARGDVEDARTHFDAVTRNTSYLEGYAGYIDTSLRAGRKDLETDLTVRFASNPKAPELLFGLSYLEARKLAGEDEADALKKDAEEAKDRLKIALKETPNSVAIHHLWGYLRHQEYLRTGDKTNAMKANAHYLVAVDLARDNPRYQAASLSGLAFLHARLGNHSMAAGFFEQREKLPFANAKEEIADCLTHARSLFHADREKEAAELSDHCVELAKASPQLGRFVPFALDRSALYHLDSAEYAKARARYDQLESLVEKVPSQDGEARRNRFVLHLGRAAAESGSHEARAALADLDEAEKLFHLPGGIALMKSSYARKTSSGAFTPALMAEDHEVLLTGIRAQTLAQSGDLPAAQEQSKRRLAMLTARANRYADDGTDADDRGLLAYSEAHLASDAYRLGDVQGALAHVESGLVQADLLEKLSLIPVHHITLTLLREYADLHFDGHVPLEKLKLDLPGRLARFYSELTDRPHPKLVPFRDRFGVYLDRLMIEGVKVKIP